jgi:hypothetical protein
MYINAETDDDTGAGDDDDDDDDGGGGGGGDDDDDGGDASLTFAVLHHPEDSADMGRGDRHEAPR